MGIVKTGLVEPDAVTHARGGFVLAGPSHCGIGIRWRTFSITPPILHVHVVLNGELRRCPIGIVQNKDRHRGAGWGGRAAVGVQQMKEATSLPNRNALDPLRKRAAALLPNPA